MDENYNPMEKDSRIIAAFSYLFGLLICVLIYLIKKEDRFVRFHAVQAIILDVVVMIAGTLLFVIAWAFMFAGMISIPLIVGSADNAASGLMLAPFGLIWVGLMVGMGAIVILRLYCAYRAFSGDFFRLPIIGAFSEQYI
ncbi:DUF4870 domain-containing protein [Candidatus Micrarchaeota archaeon]|nr:DUF4870 domain-containing protein [Candidatus Micrarchaeota archaeon]